MKYRMNSRTFEVLPDKGFMKCILVVVTENGTTEFPQTVAPPLAPKVK